MDLRDSISKVAALASPRNVVLVGASDKPGGWPAAVWHALKRYQFPGPIYPLNPNRKTINGEPCYPDFASLPEKPDHIVMLVPGAAVPDMLESGARAGARSATIFSTGFAETNTLEGIALERRLADIVAKTGIAVSGPNCTGNISAKSRLVTLVDHRVLNIQPGAVALVGQSGGVLLYANHILADRGIPVGFLMTSGNEVGLACADYIAYFAEEPSVKVIFCYVETVKDPEKFKAACALAQKAGKPVIVFKLGASEEGRKTAVTHTGALAGSAEVFDAVTGELGVIRVGTLDEAIEAIELVVHMGVPVGRRLGALTLSGAYRGILLDGAVGTNFTFPKLAAETEAKLAPILSVGSSVGNPADGGFSVLTSVEAYIASIAAMADDPSIDVLILQAELPREEGMAASWEERFQRIDELAGRRKKKVVFISMFSRVLTDYSRKVRAGLKNVAFVQESVKSLRALEYLARWSEAAERARKPAAPAASGRARSPEALAARDAALAAAKALPPGGTAALSEPESKALAAGYGIASPAELLTASTEAAAKAGARIGYPVVLKAASKDLAHKSDLGAVILDIQDDAALRKAYATIIANLERGRFAGRLDGMLVCKQVKGGVELVLGIHRDPEMGLVVMVGAGGVLLELIKDVSFVAPPIDRAKALAALERTRIFKLLKGYRGAAAYDLDGIADAIVALGRMAEELGDSLESVDINPFVALPGERAGLALDALVVLRRPGR